MASISNALARCLRGILLAALLLAPLSASAQEEPLVLTIAGADGLSSEDPLLCHLMERFDVEFETVRIDSADASYIYRRLAASNSLPDIMLYDSEWDFSYFVQTNAIRPLPANMAAYPHLKAYLTYPYSRALQYDGKLWGIPRSLYSEEQDPLGYCVVMHKEIFDSLGMDKPSTLEEWFDLLCAVKERFPGMIPLTSDSPKAMYYMTYYSAPAFNTWIWENDRYVPGFYTDAYFESIDALRLFWDRQLLDPDFMNVGSGRPTGIDRFLLGRAAAMICETSPHKWMSEIVTLWSRLYPEDDLAEHMQVLFIPSNVDGLYGEAHALNLSSVYFGTNVDDARMDRILSMFDWLCSEEGKRFRRYGLEGEDYEVAGDGTIARMQDNGATLYAKYPSYATLRVFPSLDTDYMLHDDSLNPFVTRLIREYGEWKENIRISEIHTTSLTANTVLAAAGIYFNPSIEEISFRMLCAPEGGEATYQNIMEELRRQGIEDMINKVTLTLKH